MKIINWVFFSVIAVSVWSCNESSSNERYIVNSSQKTIILYRGYDRNNIYSTMEIYSGDTVYLDYQGMSGQWDMQSPIQSSYDYYYGDSIYLEVVNNFILNKDPYNFNEWDCYLREASALPSDFYYDSYFIIRDSYITP